MTTILHLPLIFLFYETIITELNMGASKVRSHRTMPARSTFQKKPWCHVHFVHYIVSSMYEVSSKHTLYSFVPKNGMWGCANTLIPFHSVNQAEFVSQQSLPQFPSCKLEAHNLPLSMTYLLKSNLKSSAVYTRAGSQVVAPFSPSVVIAFSLGRTNP